MERSLWVFVSCFVCVIAAVPLRVQSREAVVEEAMTRLRMHDFHPLTADGSMTADRTLGEHGIADLDDPDWRVRLLSIRDLVQAGAPAVPRMIAGLSDSSMHVRLACASALGILRATEAVAALERAAAIDESPIVRSQAVTALGQMESSRSLPLLKDRLKDDPSRDVRHQCELAIDQIQKQVGATPQLLEAFRNLDPSRFETVRPGDVAPDFALEDTEGSTWRLSQSRGRSWVVLIWVFADWCPVCHGEFRELLEMQEEFEGAGVRVFTIEAHDRYRGRVMVGKEIEPDYWFAKASFQEAYTQGIWWPHLLDRAGAAGAVYGVDPMAFAVHSEYINRPSTIIIDPEGIVRFAYYGTYWGDRPTIRQTLEMVSTGSFGFEHSKRLQDPGEDP